VLDDVGEMLELAGENFFRVCAYHNVARAIWRPSRDGRRAEPRPNRLESRHRHRSGGQDCYPGQKGGITASSRTRRQIPRRAARALQASGSRSEASPASNLSSAPPRPAASRK
jgi:hypothetical protein